MKIIKLNITWFLLLFVIGIASCEKDEIKDGGGKTIVKIKDGGEDPLIVPLDVNPPIETIQIADIRKDAVTQADANAATTITITNTQAFLNAYNTANGTSYELLPVGAYTITPESGVTVSGNTWTINLAAGELARVISISLNKSQLDLTKSYAFGLQITQSSVGTASLGKGSGIVNVIVKNKYDGIYSVVSGTVTRYTAPGVPAGDALSGSLAGNPDVILATAGPNTVSIPPSGADEGQLLWAAGTNSAVGGIDGLRVTVDPVTNLTTITSAANATLANWAGHVNKYDPATKTFYLAFRWNPTANVREYEVVLKYKGPR
jgi:Domain of unknown function (DUF1735).